MFYLISLKGLKEFIFKNGELDYNNFFLVLGVLIAIITLLITILKKKEKLSITINSQEANNNSIRNSEKKIDEFSEIKNRYDSLNSFLSWFANSNLYSFYLKYESFFGINIDDHFKPINIDELIRDIGKLIVIDNSDVEKIPLELNLEYGSDKYNSTGFDLGIWIKGQLSSVLECFGLSLTCDNYEDLDTHYIRDIISKHIIDVDTVKRILFKCINEINNFQSFFSNERFVAGKKLVSILEDMEKMPEDRFIHDFFISIQNDEELKTLKILHVDILVD